MISIDQAGLARRMWRLYEPVHDVTYFCPEAVDAGKALGLKGFWMTYFAFRAAPLGRCSSAVVAASFYGFPRDPVERAVPEVWQRTSPEAAIEARQTSAAQALRRIWRDAGVSEDGVADIADVLWDIAGHDPSHGRVLAAANQVLARPVDPVQRLWQATTTLREHRGDGHVMALVRHGIAPVEANLLKVAAGESDLGRLRRARSFPDEDWDAAEDALAQRGIVRDGVLTDAGRELRDAVECLTDRLAMAPWQRPGVDLDVIAERLGPLAAAVTASDDVPPLNPVGLGPGG